MIDALGKAIVTQRSRIGRMSAVMIRTALAAAALGALLPAQAAARSDTQLWTTGSVTVNVSDRVRVAEEVVLRVSDRRDGLYEVENTLLASYKLADGIWAGAGYVHNPQYDAGDFTVLERRAREQIGYDNFATIGRAKLSARLRLEQRWRDGVGGTGWRTRPFVRMTVPLGDKGAPSLLLSNETFFNLNSVSFQAQDGLDRMRTAATLQIPVMKGVNAEVGYLNQHRFVRGGPDNDDHVANLAIAFTF
jgi:hypothetical protein